MGTQAKIDSEEEAQKAHAARLRELVRETIATPSAPTTPHEMAERAAAAARQKAKAPAAKAKRG